MVAGPSTTCAIDEFGAVWCWGSNNDREFFVDGGDSPTPIRTGITQARAIAVGLRSVCVLRSDGLTCSGEFSQLPRPFNPFAMDCIVAQEHHFCVAGSGSMSCIDADAGVRVVGSFSSLPPIDGRCSPRASASYQRVCFLGSSATVECGLPSVSWPTSRFGVSLPTAISSSRDAICVANAATIGCRFDGTGTSWLLGQAVSADASVSLPGGASRTELGNDCGCLQTAAGDVSCWYFDGGMRPYPSLRGAESLSVGSKHGCAILDGGVWCFWSNDNQRSGVRDAGFLQVPQPIGS